MSGPHLVEQASEVAPNAASAALPAEDAAASLRAAALLTLKSKRRKLTSSSDTPHIPRPFDPPPASVELDYGSEEPSAGQPSESPAPTVQLVQDAASEQGPMNVDDDQSREEGEISDSETAPPSPKSKSQPTSPKVAEQEKAAAQMPPPPLQPKIEPMSPSLSFAVPRTLVFPPEYPAPPTIVDENHIRPGLSLTQAQYELAKDTILDLLGWGVPPEYLVDSGLSREIIFYVFVELNLRLPKNLDITGLMPYMPPSATVHSVEPANVPPRLQQSDTTPSLSATAPPFIPGTSNGNGSTPSLTDMEQQRKAELLARKAVLASRKSRPQKSISRVSPPSPGPSVSSSSASKAVPTKTVDDFLNSIGPVGPSSNGTSPSTSAANPPPSFSVDAMDVDDEIPGLSGGLTTDYTPLARPAPTTRSPSASNMLSPKSPAPPTSVVFAISGRLTSMPPSTANNSNGTLLYGNDDDMDVVPGLFQMRSSWDDPASAGGRKAIKRPLAMDFDMDPGPSRLQARTDNYRPPVRRRTTGFAGITQRRCIIDLSDSEEEEDEATLQDVPSRAESRGPKAITPQPSVAPTLRVNTPTTPLTTPAALLEKEEQIRRMRELIAQREESKLKKLALASRGTVSLDVRTNGSVAIKQEEEDSASARSLEPSRSSSWSTPEIPSNGRGSQSQDERTVLNNLLPRETYGDATVVESDDTGEQSESAEVDVIGSCPETSAQVDAIDNADDEQMPDETPVFVTYRSLLDSHPLLRAHSRQDSAPLPSSAPVAGSSVHANSVADIDLKPLKQIAVLKYLSDPQGRVCQYDISGECRDKDCENIHLSRLSTVEPSGTSASALPHVANLFIACPPISSHPLSLSSPSPPADICPAPLQTRTLRNSCAPRSRPPSASARKSS
ncbi:hypothetical protein GSI_15502 [Ganoderma sinense ZZ0214-1]|uniref:Zinc-finger domain-containing protein n=1 Tax=Ganoderma sinense ZZ0214-1 TaxID=1077348 RepID=A0A2G8RMR0_9APHY|nr:hypothetical protein GSI_15502 [Ganoderma sinense ZZ0214-1]